jgi:hypothetical protein
MASDYQEKEKSKLEKYIDYRFDQIDYNLFNLQRQVMALAKLMNISPEQFMEAVADGEAVQKYLNELNEAFKRQQEAKKATQTPSND